MKEIKILVVDDHPIVAEGLANMLSGEKDISLVKAATNSKKALSILKRKKNGIDIAIVDYSLKGDVMDGSKLAKIIVKKFPTVKVLALSVHFETAFVGAFLAAGASGYLEKDGDRNKIIKAIRAVAAGGKYFPMIHTTEKKDAVITITEKKPVRLTEREKEILVYIVRGMTHEEIAKKLFISPLTVKSHHQQLNKKTGAHNIAQLISYSKELSLLPESSTL